MNDVVPLLRRRNSISTAASMSSSSTDLELLPMKPTSQRYTSLKDLLPSAAVNSPRPNPAPLAQPGSDICIRNRLVKQAAWAYLQPMSTSPGSAGAGFFSGLCPRIAAFFESSHRRLIRVVDWTLRAIRIWIPG